MGGKTRDRSKCVRYGAARRLLATAVLVLVPTTGAAQLATCDYGAPHPDAPPETSDFQFLVGNWHIGIVQPGPDGGWGPTVAEAYWEGRYAMGGFAVVDTWYDQIPWKTEGAPGRGVNSRMFDPKTGLWQMAWLHTGLDHVRRLQARRKGDDVEMWQLNPDGTRFEGRRTLFHDIEEDSWVRTDERTTDGSTWQKALRLEATRLACPVPDAD